MTLPSPTLSELKGCRVIDATMLQGELRLKFDHGLEHVLFLCRYHTKTTKVTQRILHRDLTTIETTIGETHFIFGAREPITLSVKHAAANPDKAQGMFLIREHLLKGIW